MSERVTRYHLPGLATVAALPKARGGRRPYRRGSDAERALLRDLQQDGALALRSAGSGGPYDLAVILPHGGRLFQCKLVSASPTEGQIARWLAALPPVPDGWSSELWVRTPRGWQSYLAPPGAAVRDVDVTIEECTMTRRRQRPAGPVDVSMRPLGAEVWLDVSRQATHIAASMGLAEAELYVMVQPLALAIDRIDGDPLPDDMDGRRDFLAALDIATVCRLRAELIELSKPHPGEVH